MIEAEPSHYAVTIYTTLDAKAITVIINTKQWQKDKNGFIPGN